MSKLAIDPTTLQFPHKFVEAIKGEPGDFHRAIVWDFALLLGFTVSSYRTSLEIIRCKKAQLLEEGADMSAIDRQLAEFEGRLFEAERMKECFLNNVREHWEARYR